MRAHSAVLPDGAVLVADQQTKGKGRGGNVWTSPAGCLMFTALRRLQVCLQTIAADLEGLASFQEYCCVPQYLATAVVNLGIRGDRLPVVGLAMLQAN